MFGTFIFPAYHEMSLCSVMQDVDSNNYSSLRSYAEGVVSYSSTVQAWHHFMQQQVIEETYRILPCEVACKLSAYLLCKSLDKWVLRFCSVKPSESRVPQMRADITAILAHTWYVFASIYTLKIIFSAA